MVAAFVAGETTVGSLKKVFDQLMVVVLLKKGGFQKMVVVLHLRTAVAVADLVLARPLILMLRLLRQRELYLALESIYNSRLLR